MPLEYLSNRSTAAEVMAHLTECDADFEPPLSQRVELPAYARKLVERAQRFEAWSDGELVGLVAVYCDDLVSRRAFITSVSVSPRWRGKAVGVHLMLQCLDFSSRVGMQEVRLEVAESNTPAIGLYAKLGFVPEPGTTTGMVPMGFWLER